MLPRPAALTSLDCRGIARLHDITDPGEYAPRKRRPRLPGMTAAPAQRLRMS